MWQLRESQGIANTKSHCTTNLIQEIHWEKHRRVAASAWEQKSERQVLNRASWGWTFSEWPGIGGIFET